MRRRLGMASGACFAMVACQAFLDLEADEPKAGFDAGTSAPSLDGGLDAASRPDGSPWTYDCAATTTLCVDFDEDAAGWDPLIPTIQAGADATRSPIHVSPPFSARFTSQKNGALLQGRLATTMAKGVRLSLSVRIDQLEAPREVRPFTINLSAKSNDVELPTGLWPAIRSINGGLELDVAERLDPLDGGPTAYVEHRIQRKRFPLREWVRLDVEAGTTVLRAFWDGELVLDVKPDPRWRPGYPIVEVGLIYSGAGEVYVDDVLATFN